MSQDWAPLIIKKSINKQSIKEENERLLKIPNMEKEIIRKTSNLNSNSSVTVTKDKNDGDVPKIKYVTNLMSQTIRKSRMEKNYSQEELAKLCNMDKNILSDIENPIKQTVYNAQQINKISKVLQITIPRP
jgi:ribosome-binding protein aMBF1 (putative translation factor)